MVIKVWAVSAVILVAALMSSSGLAGQHWSVPRPVAEIVGDFNTAAPFLSFDGKSLYFRSDQPGAKARTRFYAAGRAEAQGPFTSITELIALNDANSGSSVLQPNGSYLVRAPASPIYSVWVSSDNLRMYYTVSGSLTGGVVCTERTSVDEPWRRGARTVLGSTSPGWYGTALPVKYSLYGYGKISLTEDELFIAAMLNGSVLLKRPPASSVSTAELQYGVRNTLGENFGAPMAIEGVDSLAGEGEPFIMPDGLVIYFASCRDNEGYKIFKAVRVSKAEAFGNVEVVSDLNLAGCNLRSPALSADGSVIYFEVQRGTKSDIYYSEALRQPAVLAKHLIEHAAIEKDKAGEAIAQARVFEREAAANLEIAQKDASGKYRNSLLKARILLGISMVRDKVADESIQKSLDELEEALKF
jgi:hypothetical protein